jgi:hypothetical protein
MGQVRHGSATTTYAVRAAIQRSQASLAQLSRELGINPKTLYNRWKRWGDMGVCARMMEGLASECGEEKVVMIDATYLKAQRTASSLRAKKGGPTTSAACPISMRRKSSPDTTFCSNLVNPMAFGSGSSHSI